MRTLAVMSPVKKKQLSDWLPELGWLKMEGKYHLKLVYHNEDGEVFLVDEKYQMWTISEKKYEKIADTMTGLAERYGVKSRCGQRDI